MSLRSCVGQVFANIDIKVVEQVAELLVSWRAPKCFPEPLLKLVVL